MSPPADDPARAGPRTLASDGIGVYARELARALPSAVVLVFDAEGRVIAAEGRALGRSAHRARNQLLGRTVAELLPAELGAVASERLAAALDGKPGELHYRSPGDQMLRWVQLTPTYLDDARAPTVTVIVQDLSDRQLLRAELRTERQRRRMAEEMAGFGHWEVEVKGRLVALSDGVCRLLGRAPGDQPRLRELLEQVDADQRSFVYERIIAAETEVRECECDATSLDGTRRRLFIRGVYTVDGHGRTLVAGTMVDVSALRAAESARRESDQLFRQGFEASPIGMALIDGDTGRYLQVNDALCRLLGRTREQLMELSYIDVSHPDERDRDGARRLEIEALGLHQLEFEKRYVRPDGSAVWASVHDAVVRDHAGALTTYFSQIVDITARKEREAQLVREAADLERLNELREALAGDRLILHAQPIVQLSTGLRLQQELLVRLRREDGELLLPGQFLPVAERFGLIREVDQRVTRRAIELAAGGNPVEVNLSALSLGDTQLLAVIQAEIARTGADPQLLVFEVTETALMANLDSARTFADALRQLGCRLALDDFGTGYGTFTYLKHIPTDFVKIDREFIRELARSEADQRMVRTIVAMAREFGKETIAEGVEDAETLQQLRDLGVDHAQGYFIGKPAGIGAA